MGDKTSIEWTDATWPVVNGCRRCSPGCEHCYAERLTATRLSKTPKYQGLAVMKNGDPRWTGESRLWTPHLNWPLRWKKPRRIFVADMGDLFFEEVSDGEILRVFSVIARCPQHTFQILTKRADRMREWVERWNDLVGEPWEPKLVRGPEATRNAHQSGRGQMFAEMLETMGEPPAGCAFPTFDWMEGMRWWPPFEVAFPNVWLGVSVEDRKRLSRLDALRRTPAAVRFVSAEPLLEDLGEVDLNGIDWVIVGGESGPGARPMHAEWVRSIVRQCKAAQVSVFVKQLGANYCDAVNGVGGHQARPPSDLVQLTRRLNNRKGGDMAEWPPDLRVRQMPEVRP